MEDNTCEQCSSILIERKNSQTGTKFWGCSAFPKCKYNEPHEDEDMEGFHDHYMGLKHEY